FSFRRGSAFLADLEPGGDQGRRLKAFGLGSGFIGVDVKRKTLERNDQIPVSFRSRQWLYFPVCRAARRGVRHPDFTYNVLRTAVNPQSKPLLPSRKSLKGKPGDLVVPHCGRARVIGDASRLRAVERA